MTLTLVVAGHAALFALVLTSKHSQPPALDHAVTQMFDVALPPPPPPPPPPREREKAKDEAGVEGSKAEPTPIVAPVVRPLPTPNALPAAPVAGSGSDPRSGAGSTGSGPGAGGSGSGTGGGGSGGDGIGEHVRLLSGGLTRRDYRFLRGFDRPSGRAVLALMIDANGRVAQCSTRESSGDRAIDAALCQILQPRMRWAPARDRAGRPIAVGLYYTAVWDPN